jgi:hypothetical protein
MKRLIRKANHEKVKSKIQELINYAKSLELQIEKTQVEKSVENFEIEGDNGSISIEHDTRNNQCQITSFVLFFDKGQEYSGCEITNKEEDCIDLLNNLMEEYMNKITLKTQ